MAEKLNPFYEVPKNEVPINITSELKETFESVDKALSDARVSTETTYSREAICPNDRCKLQKR